MRADVQIGSKSVPMEVTAATPFKYRQELGRDIYKDMAMFMQEDDLGLGIDMERYEAAVNFSYMFNKEAGEKVPSSPVKWVEQFEFMELMEALPSILGL